MANISELINRDVEFVSYLLSMGGEVTPEFMLDFEQHRQELVTKTDAISWSFKKYTDDIKRLKEMKQVVADKIKMLERSQGRFEDYLSRLLKSHPEKKIKTDLSQISYRFKVTTQLEILDFDKAVEWATKNAPNSVTIETHDNERTIKINKNELKKYDLTQLDFFRVINNTTEWVDIK